MKRGKKCLGAAIALYLTGTILYLCGAFNKAENFFSDMLYTSYRPAHPRIFVIGIDSDTLDQYGPWGNWSRMMSADLINYLNEEEESKPAVIGLDIMYAGNTTDREDGALVEAVKNGGNVVVASQAYFSDSIQKKRGEDSIQKYELPFDSLNEAAETGLMNVLIDSDGVVRKGIYQFSYDNETVYGLAAQVARMYMEKMGLGEPAVPPLDQNNQWIIPFAARPGTYYGIGTKGTSWVRVMNGEIPRELFADSIVLIGPYATGMLDHHVTAADRSNPMYGIEVHANVVQSLLEGYYKVQMPGYIPVIAVMILLILVYVAFCRMSIRMWTITTVSICVLYLLAALLTYRLGYLLPLFYPLLVVALTYLSLLVTNSILLTIEKAGLYDQMHRLFINCIRTIANAIDAKDPCTSGHCQRVSEYSMMLGKAMDCSPEVLADLEYAALLHDVGKIGVSDNVLKKEGSLTKEEYEEMKKHPMLGARILSEIKEFRGNIADGARYHHERYDGNGYCEGIAGEEIPIFGRIISIADTYDAMTQNRPYRKRLSKETAIAELQKNSGKQFDPQLVALFIKLLAECPPPVEQGPIEPEENQEEQKNYSDTPLI